MCALARELGMVLVVPVFEQEQAGVYYNCAFVVDADGTYLGKYRKTHIPQVQGFLEKYYFRPGNLGYPVFQTAVGPIGVYICYDRHFPEGWRALGLAGARIVFNPSATSRSLSQYLWRLEQPAAAVANEYFVGAINRVGVEPLGDDDFYGARISSTPGASWWGRRRPTTTAPSSSATSTWTSWSRYARPGPFTVTATRPPTPRSSNPEPLADKKEPGAHADPGGRSSARPDLAADVLVEDERIVALGRARARSGGAFAEGRPRHRRPGRLVVPGGSTPTPTWSCPSAAPSPRTPSRRGRGPRPGEVPPRSWTSPSSARARRCGAGLEACSAKAEGNCAIDYGFHMIVSDVNEQSCKEMDVLVHEGVTSFKLFMAYPGVFYSTDGEILRAMQQARANGATIMMHAENGIAIDVLVSQALSRGETATPFPRPHPTRPARGRGDSRAIALAKVTGAPLYIVHLSTTGALEAVAEARSGARTPSPRPARSTCSSPPTTWPAEGFEGAKYVCSPPLRAREHQANLWRGLRTDDLSVVSTDHCPFCFKEQKELGGRGLLQDPQRLARRRAPHRPHLPGGGGGRDHPRALGRGQRHHAGADVRPLPEKGGAGAGVRRRHRDLRPGRHADHLGGDPPHERRLLRLRRHEVTGRVDTVLSRGKVVIEAGRYVGDKGHGRYLPRKTNEYLR